MNFFTNIIVQIRAISIWRNALSLKNGIHQPELTAVRTAGFAHFVRTSPVPAGRALASEKGLKLRFVFI